MNTKSKHRVMFLPGGIAPAPVRYSALIPELGDDIEPLLKDLEVYADEAPPAGYSIEQEIDGVVRAATEAGWERFHLYGYSGGGAVALAFLASHPDRLLSLALDEPATDWTEEDLSPANREQMRSMIDMPPEEMFPVFVRGTLRPGVELPTLPGAGGEAPPWMARRPAGLKAMMRAFLAAKVDTEHFRHFAGPVYLSYGSLSAPQSSVEISERLSKLFSDFTCEEYEGLHHFNPSMAAEPGRLAAALRLHWAKAQVAI